MSTNNNKTKRSITKEYQIEQKQKQKQSIVLRTFVFMRMLVCNANYTFVMTKAKRQAQKTLCSYPIEKIYNSNGELIFNSDSFVIESKNTKTKYCQKFVCELLITELEKCGYSFQKLQTKKAKKMTNGLEPITLTKIQSVEIPQIAQQTIQQQEKDSGVKQFPLMNGTKIIMTKLENTIGMDGYTTIKNLFDGETKCEKIVFGNSYIIESVYDQLGKQGIVKIGTDIFIGEGYEDRVEQIYVNQWNMSLNTYLNEANQINADTNQNTICNHQIQNNQSGSTTESFHFEYKNQLNQNNEFQNIHQQTEMKLPSIHELPQMNNINEMIPDQYYDSYNVLTDNSNSNVNNTNSNTESTSNLMQNNDYENDEYMEMFTSGFINTYF